MMNKIFIKFMLLITLVVSILFMFYTPDGKIGFPFSNVVLSADTWVYFFCEHMILIILSGVIYMISSKKEWSFVVFHYIQIFDTFDYVLTYGDRWTDYLPSWNIIKVSIYSCALIYDITREEYDK